MSLEDALATHTAALERNSDLLEKLVARAEASGAVAAGAAAADAGKKATGKKAAGAKAESDGDAGKTETASGPTTDDVKKAASAWLGEYKGVEGDPETGARREAILKALASLCKKENAQIVDVPAEDLPRVLAWLDKKKAEDKGFGVGRLTAPPTAAADEAGAGDDDI